MAALALAVVAVAVAVTLTRGFSSRDQVPVTDAFLFEQDRLTLVVDTCGREPELDLLREQDEVVEVAVVSTRTFGGSGGGDCQDSVEVRLQAPLGERSLVDATTGGALTVDAG